VSGRTSEQHVSFLFAKLFLFFLKEKEKSVSKRISTDARITAISRRYAPAQRKRKRIRSNGGVKQPGRGREGAGSC